MRVGGLPLHVLSEGDGPVVVLSAGLGMAWFDWDAVAALLVPHRTVVRFDRPGLGLSAPSAAPPDLVDEADRIAGLLDALGHRAPATVVGHSMAGFHVEAFARLHPDRCDGLVLVDGSVEEDPGPGCRARSARPGRAGRPVCSPPPGCRTSSARRAPPAHPRRDGGPPRHRGLGAGRLPHQPGAAGLRPGERRLPYQAADLAELRRHRPLPAVPVTVLAAYDGSESPRQLRWLARQRALAAELGGRCTLAAPAGHLVMADAPEAVARAVLELR
ncbi:alpha/beta hydrolase [Streptomyces noursei]|nr:alpha/beta hydrolase [Streptomyces noursei]